MAAAAVTGLFTLGCLGAGPTVVHRVETSVVREQAAAVPSPSPLLATSGPMERGQVSLQGGGDLSAPPWVASTSQFVAPIQGVARVATAIDDHGLELGVSATGGPASSSVFARAADPSFDGFVGRAQLGLRSFVGLRNTSLEWAWTFDLGAAATTFRRTDTITVIDAWVGSGTSTDISSSTEPDRVRLHPDARLGTLFRVPVGVLPAHALLGAQVQTWPVYWGTRTSTETCTSWSDGSSECHVSGSVEGRPSRLVGVFSPTVGASFRTEDLGVHVLGSVNLGPEEVARVPFGLVVTFEHRAVPRVALAEGTVTSTER